MLVLGTSIIIARSRVGLCCWMDTSDQVEGFVLVVSAVLGAGGGSSIDAVIESFVCLEMSSGLRQ